MYSSAQALDFLARTKKYSFKNVKSIVSHPEFPDGNQLVMKTSRPFFVGHVRRLVTFKTFKFLDFS
jgi:hypothetical protein